MKKKRQTYCTCTRYCSLDEFENQLTALFSSFLVPVNFKLVYCSLQFFTKMTDCDTVFLLPELSEESSVTSEQPNFVIVTVVNSNEIIFENEEVSNEIILTVENEDDSNELHSKSKCNVCGIQLRQARYLLSHMKEVHDLAKPYACHKCPVGFFIEWILNLSCHTGCLNESLHFSKSWVNLL